IVEVVVVQIVVVEVVVVEVVVIVEVVVLVILAGVVAGVVVVEILVVFGVVVGRIVLTQLDVIVPRVFPKRHVKTPSGELSRRIIAKRLPRRFARSSPVLRPFSSFPGLWSRSAAAQGSHQLRASRGRLGIFDSSDRASLAFCTLPHLTVPLRMGLGMPSGMAGRHPERRGPDGAALPGTVQLEVVSRIGKIERFVAERKVRDDVLHYRIL